MIDVPDTGRDVVVAEGFLDDNALPQSFGTRIGLDDFLRSAGFRTGSRTFA